MNPHVRAIGLSGFVLAAGCGRRGRSTPVDPLTPLAAASARGAAAPLFPVGRLAAAKSNVANAKRRTPVESHGAISHLLAGTVLSDRQAADQRAKATGGLRDRLAAGSKVDASKREM